jgi:hypothetical protein
VKQQLEENNTHSNLRILLLQYLCNRGFIMCSECSEAFNLLHIIQEFKASQDIIVWGNFVMGMVSSKLLPIQSAYFFSVEQVK